ncbi:Imm50 family immunity protein [Leisingera aquimarina]|uniref:Imm50 family immunity protein n=1 Tax=Leisingera aquimarina TaxID=476529 RepID=UPI000565120C|nr:Imm50 family immunity protein [Leisingera aquimarina]
MDEDESISIYKAIPGGEELLGWFGKVPNFHDAEVLDLHLKRKGRSTLRLHAWNMTSKVRNGYFVLEKHAVVEFSIGRIVTLELGDFNHQNVIDGLTISRVEVGENSQAFELLLEPSFGLAGIIRAEELSVAFIPGKPDK